MTNKISLTDGNINKVLLSLALPIVGSSFLQMAYGLIDMIWIGRLGSESVAAIGTATFFINLGMAVNSIIITGAGIKISHTIGANKPKEANEYIKIAFVLNAIMAFIYIAITIIFKNNLISFFKINNLHVEEMAVSYLTIAVLGLVFKYYNFSYTRIFNNFGDSKLPFKVNSMGVLLNIILDPVLIFGLSLGVKGAALATLISQGVVSFLFFRYSKQYFIIKDLTISNYKAIREILILGTPVFLQKLLFSVIGISLARIISKWGASAIAAQKIGLQIESITFMTVGGLYGASASFIGQNYGSKNKERIEKGYITALKYAWGISIITSFFFILFPEALIKFFVNDPATMKIGTDYLKIIGFSQIFMATEQVTNGSFSGIGKPKIPSIISVIFTGLRIPLALFLSRESLYGLNGIWMSIAITSVIKGVLSSLLLLKSIKRISFIQKENILWENG